MGSDPEIHKTHSLGERALTYVGGADMAADMAADVATETAVFQGGPLDGRTHEVNEPIQGQLIRHVHLHEGPKIETWYRLARIDGCWVFEVTEVDT